MNPQILNPNSPLIELARRAKRLAHIALAIPLAWGFALAGVLAQIGLITILFGSDTNPDVSFSARAVTLLAAAVPVLLVWLWLKFYEQRPFWTVGFTRDGAALKFLCGVLIGVGLFALAVIILAVTGNLTSSTANPQNGIAALGGVLILALLWVVQGSSEEIVFRGWLMSSVGARYRPLMGILVSTILFALIHAFNPGITILALVNIVLVGLFLAFYGLREGSIWGICGLHAAWNWAQGSVFGFSVSGTGVPGGSLFNLQSKPGASELLTGGVFGPEASLIVTVILSGAILAALFWPQTTPQSEA